ncbi:Arc family DNA-binding protein [Stutzerimonas nitrititolerans]|uniref:Arc family DNA-binding protein n=1 Tax=Stutzerimonas nitrititolerans TaxID=2482751 RepID=UPI00289AB67D|nr:Arc family DNA-binding protein [Stutzerimonas nitrititolerans]
MSRTDPQFRLRMPAALRAQGEQSAWAARRSLNAEILIRLEASFAQAAPSTNEKERSA